MRGRHPDKHDGGAARGVHLGDPTPDARGAGSAERRRNAVHVQSTVHKENRGQWLRQRYVTRVGDGSLTRDTTSNVKDLSPTSIKLLGPLLAIGELRCLLAGIGTGSVS